MNAEQNWIIISQINPNNCYPFQTGKLENPFLEATQTTLIFTRNCVVTFDFDYTYCSKFGNWLKIIHAYFSNFLKNIIFRHLRMHSSSIFFVAVLIRSSLHYYYFDCNRFSRAFNSIFFICSHSGKIIFWWIWIC